MDNSTLLYAQVFLGAVFLSAVSQVLLKFSAGKQYKNPLFEYLNPLVIGGYGLFVLTTLLNVLAYRGIPLSLGPVLESTGYLYVTFFGVVLFGEKLTRKKILALALILMGIAVYALG